MTQCFPIHRKVGSRYSFIEPCLGLVVGWACMEGRTLEAYSKAASYQPKLLQRSPKPCHIPDTLDHILYTIDPCKGALSTPLKEDLLAYDLIGLIGGGSCDLWSTAEAAAGSRRPKPPNL